MDFWEACWSILFMFLILEICMAVIDRMLRRALNLPSGEEE